MARCAVNGRRLCATSAITMADTSRSDDLAKRHERLFLRRRGVPRVARRVPALG